MLDYFFAACFFLLFSILLAGCAETALVVHTAKEIANLSKPPVPKGRYKVGSPYQIKNVNIRNEIAYFYCLNLQNQNIENLTHDLK